MREEYVIGLITPILDGYYFGNIIKSLSYYAEKANKKKIRIVVIGSTDRTLKSLYAHDYVDLWVTVLYSLHFDVISAIRKQAKPVIGINSFLETNYTIKIDNNGLIVQALDHLKEHGHDQIGYIGSDNYKDARARFVAFKNHHSDYHDDLFYNTSELNVPVIAKQIAQSKDSVKAFICGTDLIASELINELKTYGIEIPRDIALISFDDIPAAQSNLHSLTTVHINFDDIGRHIVNAFVHYLDHQSFPGKSVDLEAYLVFRESCGCEWQDQQIGLTNPVETIDYLAKMVSRNFILGRQLQFYNTEELLQLNWLNQTPIRKGLIGLNDNNVLKINKFETFDVASEKPTEQEFLGEIKDAVFPPRSLLFDSDFMQDQNTIIVIPIIQENQNIGVFGFVGLADISTEFAPLHTTYHLSYYFGAGYLRADIIEKINQYSQQLEMVTEIIYDGVWEYSHKNNWIVCRGGIVQHFGGSRRTAEFNLQQIIEIIHPDDRKIFLNEFSLNNNDNNQFEIEVRIITPVNDMIWIQVIGQLYYNDDHLYSGIGSVKDITSRKESEAKINELAYNDTLTGLANRASFDQQLQLELVKAEESNEKFALILFNLDRFKVINDSYGYHTGDHILKAIAKRIYPILSEDQLFARFGGDEFILLMPDLNDNEEVNQLANEIVNLINQPFYDQHRQYQITTSVGISIYPDHAKPNEMLVSADIAMQSAKSEGRNRIHIFNDEIKHYNATQLKLEEQLRHAIENDELSLNFQPIYFVNSDEIYGIEALLRWNSKEFGSVSPRDFIPIAEETGLIVSIGKWVIIEAIRVKKKLNNKKPVKMFINLSSMQVNHPDFTTEMKKIFDVTEVDHTQISFEITESVMIDNFTRGKEILGQIKDMGVKLSLDDFGTGYSSLSTLRHLPFDIIKIDKSFIDDLTELETDITILKAIIEMAHSLDLLVVAEGIETKEQYDLVARLGVDFIQGYYCSRPLAEEKIESIFQDISQTKTE